MLFLRKRLLSAVCVLALSAGASQVLEASAVEPPPGTLEMFDTMTSEGGASVGAENGSGERRRADSRNSPIWTCVALGRLGRGSLRCCEHKWFR